MDAHIMAAFRERPPSVGFAATATFRSGAPPRRGDAYGVTTFPVDIAGDLAEIGDEFVAAETIVLEAVRQGASTPAILSAARAAMAEHVRQLQQRVSRQSKGG